MTGFVASVRIGRPIEVVYAYLADPLNFSQWNSAVRAVWQTAGASRGKGPSYAMERVVPGPGPERT